MKLKKAVFGTCITRNALQLQHDEGGRGPHQLWTLRDL